MSWLSRSIASLRIDDDEDHYATTNANHSQSPHHQHTDVDDDDDDDDEDEEPDNQGRGVKEDLSELRETLTRQLWGVASFLAPPPHHQTDPSVSDCNRLEFPGKSNEGSSEFAYRSGSSKFSDFLPARLDEEDAIGVTEEVLAFARNIAHHPETWLDFPLSEEEDMNDFDMSDAQRKHAMAVERLAPRLAALRFELCPAHMSEGYFWKVYFVLLHSRLNKHDAELLSTSQIMEARAMWMQELQKRTKPEPDWFPRSTFYSKESPNSPHEDFDPTSLDSPSGNPSLRTSSPFAPTTYYATTDFPTEKHPIVSNEISIIDKSVIEEEPVIKTNDKEFAAGPSYKIPVQEYDDDDGDDWLDENSELDGYSGTGIVVGTDEDVSFSDLEDNDDCTMPIKSKVVSKDLESS